MQTQHLAVVLIMALFLGGASVFPGETPNAASRVFPGADGKLVYTADKNGNTIPDFSHAGYMEGGVAIPYIPAVDTVWAVQGDSSPVIQAAIDRISALQLDKHGFRGAVQLMRGNYELSMPLSIKSSGIVLRGSGMGSDGTVLFGVGVLEAGYSNADAANLVEVSGTASWEKDESTAVDIVDEYVPVGARSFHVASAKGFKAGDTVLVCRQGNQEWIHEIGDDLENKEWRWKPFTIEYDRVITAINGNTVEVDAPVMTAIETRWGGGRLVRYKDPGRISNVGIENLCGMSDYDRNVRTTEYSNMDRSPYLGEEYYSDEKHYWTFINIDNAKNVWVRNVSAFHFAKSLASVHPGAKWVTIQDCESWDPVSICGGGRRFIYQLSGQLSLVQRCISDKGRHSFVLGGWQACGNVFLDCTATIPYSSSEPHVQWVNGTLYDNVKAPLTARWWKDISIGWAGANTVFWNCEGQFLIQKPPTAQNFAFGHSGIHATIFNTYFQDLTKPNGFIESWDRHVTPRSLYLAQLYDRLGEKALRNTGY
ncbi:MAG: hypothetical protein WCU00_00235 [Candidatus Latescibacterota bacterium]